MSVVNMNISAGGSRRPVPPGQEDCRVLLCQEITRDVFDIVFGAESLPAPAPGQFVHISCGGGSLLRRPISVCDAEDGTVRIVFERKGDGTRWLSERRPGDVINVLGPLGMGFTVDGAPTLFVGGGIGAPPLLFAAKANPSVSYAAIGFRTVRSMILGKEFNEACEKVLISTEDGSLGDMGYVTAPAGRILEEHEIKRVCACGPRVMLRAVRDLADRAGVPCEVSMEERMGCGIGACLSCACAVKRGEAERYAHVCRYGPVFNASEVVWDD